MEGDLDPNGVDLQDAGAALGSEAPAEPAANPKAKAKGKAAGKSRAKRNNLNAAGLEADASTFAELGDDTVNTDIRPPKRSRTNKLKRVDSDAITTFDAAKRLVDLNAAMTWCFEPEVIGSRLGEEFENRTAEEHLRHLYSLRKDRDMSRFRLTDKERNDLHRALTEIHGLEGEAVADCGAGQVRGTMIQLGRDCSETTLVGQVRLVKKFLDDHTKQLDAYRGVLQYGNAGAGGGAAGNLLSAAPAQSSTGTAASSSSAGAASGGSSSSAAAAGSGAGGPSESGAAPSGSSSSSSAAASSASSSSAGGGLLLGGLGSSTIGGAAGNALPNAAAAPPRKLTMKEKLQRLKVVRAPQQGFAVKNVELHNELTGDGNTASLAPGQVPYLSKRECGNGKMGISGRLRKVLEEGKKVHNLPDSIAAVLAAMYECTELELEPVREEVRQNYAITQDQGAELMRKKFVTGVEALTQYTKANRDAMSVLCPSTVMAVDGLSLLGKTEAPDTCLTLINTMLAAELKMFDDQIKWERTRYTKLQHLAKIDEVIHNFLHATGDEEVSPAEFETNLVSISKKLPGEDYYKRVCKKLVGVGVLQGDYLKSMLINKDPDTLTNDHDVPTLRHIITQRKVFVQKVQNLLPTSCNRYIFHLRAGVVKASPPDVLSYDVAMVEKAVKDLNEEQVKMLLSEDLAEIEKKPWSKGGAWDDARRSLILLASGTLARHEMMALAGSFGDKEGQTRTPQGVVKERMLKCWMDSGYNSVADLEEDVDALCDGLAGRLKTNEGYQLAVDIVKELGLVVFKMDSAYFEKFRTAKLLV
eukprot:g12169.t1